MSENSKIEWTDHTFNPWIGCTKVSPGCAHCYAEARSKRTDGVVWGKGQPRKRTSESNWKLPLKWNREAGAAIASFNESEIIRGMLGPVARPRVFCASLADWLDDEVPIQWLVDLLEIIRITPNLDWLLLTKRPENWRKRVDEAGAYANGSHQIEAAAWCSRWLDEGRPPENIWLGTTVEDQQRANERIPALLKIPAEVHFLSCEPLLGPVDLKAPRVWPYDCFPAKKWVIAGGESGPGARPMHPDWARSLRDQCQSAGVPFLFKQWGEWAPDLTSPIPTKNPGEFCYAIARVGKKAAGRLLDGVEHNEFPRAEGGGA